MVAFRQGSGRLCLDFVRTLRRRGTAAAEEELPDAGALEAWVRQCGPCDPWPVASPEADDGSPASRAAAVAAAQEFREAVHALVMAARRQEPPPSRARERVNEEAARPAPYPVLLPSGEVRWQAPDPVAATLALVARDALELVGSPAVARVRDCAGRDCGAMFLDSSRPGSRRWCSMDTCGNRAKKDAVRSRSGEPRAAG
ncbi:CGNR zinc finger domain-containing protein [Nonomuraea sp. CA-141351]|uniref:CGNR zinc finger domain-containing protein n=1 Tax=Nonomuraea sp. CA-141351 TaxID=3239996 RepID=UPI003D89EC3A